MTPGRDVNPDVSGVIDRLQGIRMETGHGIGRVFRDWMALAVHAFENDDDQMLLCQSCEAQGACDNAE